MGGEAIAEYIRKHGDKLKADFALVCDTELFAPELPTLCVGLRGLVYTELEAVGRNDRSALRHVRRRGSESAGSAVAIIGKLKDDERRILIPGFYDDVKKPTDAELKAWKSSALRRRALSQDGSRIQRADRRAGLLRALSHLGASDA